MNINDYLYIVTLADLGSFTSAAKKLFIAQPSLSQRVKHIEKYYGINIFIRNSKGIHLSEEGECFIRYAKQIINIEKDLQNEILDMKNLCSILRIGTSQLINFPFFDELIHHFHEKYPEIHFEFIEHSTPQLQQLLLSGEIDIAFCYLPIKSSELKYKIISTDRFVLVPAKGSALAEKIRNQKKEPSSCVNINLLDKEPFAINTPGRKLHEFFMSIIEDGRIKPDIQHTSKNLYWLYSLAKEGVASTIMYESFFDPSQEHEPYYCLEGYCNNDLSIAITWKKNTYLSREAKNLISFVQNNNQLNKINVDCKTQCVDCQVKSSSFQC